MQRCIALSAALGGVGLGTLSLALAEALSARGLRVALIDAFVDAPFADLAFGFEEEVLYTFSDVVEGTAPQRAAFEVKKDLFVFPSSVGSNLDGDLAAAVLAVQKALSPDVLLIASPISLLHRFFSVLDTAILVSSTEERARRASEAASAILADGPVKSSYLLLNKSAAYKDELAEEPPLLTMVDSIGLSLLGVCPREYQRDALLPFGKVAHSNFKKAVANVAARLLGERVPLLNGVRLDGFSRRHYIERAEKAAL